jgi:hypothetical protein
MRVLQDEMHKQTGECCDMTALPAAHLSSDNFTQQLHFKVAMFRNFTEYHFK